MREKERPILAQYRCLYCFRQISKWNRPAGICVRCAKYGRPNKEDRWRQKSDISRGPKSYKWKGEKAGYYSIHVWLNRELGKASYCSNDDTHKSKRYEWANISGEYKRDLNDYKPLCVPCHRKYDMSDEFIEMLKVRFRGKPSLNRKAISQYTLDGEIVATYESILDAGRKMGVSHKKISKALNGQQKTSCGYIWKIASPEQKAAPVEESVEA